MVAARMRTNPRYWYTFFNDSLCPSTILATPRGIYQESRTVCLFLLRLKLEFLRAHSDQQNRNTCCARPLFK